MSFIRAIVIMLVLAACLSVLGITSSPTATPVQTRPAIVSLPAAAAPTNPAPVATTTAASAKPTPVAVTTALAAKPANPHADHATLTPQQSAAPPRTVARTQPGPVQAPPRQAFPSATQSQQRATVMDDQRPPKVSVNTHSHWQIPPSQSRDASRTASRDAQKDTRTYSAQRDRAAPPPQDRTASRPDYRETDRRYAPASRTALRHDDVRHDRSSYSSETSRNVVTRAGYRQSQDHGRRDSQTRVSDNKRKALLREYEDNARRQYEIERELGRNFSSQPASRRDRYSDASGGRQ